MCGMVLGSVCYGEGTQAKRKKKPRPLLRLVGVNLGGKKEGKEANLPALVTAQSLLPCSAQGL